MGCCAENLIPALQEVLARDKQLYEDIVAMLQVSGEAFGHYYEAYSKCVAEHEAGWWPMNGTMNAHCGLTREAAYADGIERQRDRINYMLGLFNKWVSDPDGFDKYCEKELNELQTREQLTALIIKEGGIA